MQQRALVLGGTGLVGSAVARRLLAAGWSVDVTGRDASSAVVGTRFHVAARNDAGALRRALGPGADLVVDCLCFTAADAELLLPLLTDVGSSVMISSKAVYVDAAGNHMNSAVAPRFGEPVPEGALTMEPGDAPARSPGGYGAHKVAAERVLLESGLPVSILRASKVHGVGSVREWFFVRRALDGRRRLLLADRGLGVDHTTAAVNLAALVEVVAARPGARILNAADPDASDVRTIAATIGAHLDHAWDEVLLDDPTPPLGRTPWSTGARFELDTSAARRLGYEPVGTYAETIGTTIDWLVRTADEPRWTAARADLLAGFAGYASEDGAH
ncbi:NAD-dependent epimerase/dehydratase family protein [Cellulomonas rhizosphaerae]|uniref:NAD-dependent epimerase/dehydratase family protein n=1 Tax=Cellulomonas rhizosphaerae TaxID=2293719 RepID=A0A413RKL8_9CELL|nr:NAD-dependent epimerase/dehydratase family protein [Cellulomonas rhizosphaerae]RHA39814.1 NAD-dependent epimerase/dehydratase family protein [Cellulomonas rhizosphaerae]